MGAELCIRKRYKIKN